MRKQSSWMAMLAIALLAGACDDDKPQPPQPTAPAANAPKAAMSDEELDKANIPVPEDFDEEAIKEITEDNLDEMVAKLDEEISAAATEPAAAPDRDGD